MRKALVVGIDAYPGSPLTGCVNDAVAIAGLLERHADGAPNFSVKTLLSDRGAITRGGLKGELKALFDGDPEVALFYFAGHGLLTTFGGYIMTPDAAQYDEGVSMDELLGLANRSAARNRVIVLDCCHSGAMGSPMIHEGRLSELADGLTVLVACRPAEQAAETMGQGEFTALLLDALEGGSADLLGHVSPGSIYAYVDRALGPWAQRPVFKTNVSRFVSLRTAEAPIPAATLRRIVAHFPTPEARHELDPSYEFTSDTAEPAHVAAFKELQQLAAVGLVTPVGERHMYYAAMNRGACRLTASGVQYWKLVQAGNV